MTLEPSADDHTHAIIEAAVESLANLRGLPCPDDPGIRLHTLASLTQQLHTSIAAAVEHARCHDYNPDEITQLLGNPTNPKTPPPRNSLTRSHV